MQCFPQSRALVVMIVSKDENLEDSMPYVGSIILRILKNSQEGKIAFLDLLAELRRHNVTRYRPILFGLTFLHSIGAIDFNAPYISRLPKASTN